MKNMLIYCNNNMLNILLITARASEKEEFYSGKCKKSPKNGTMFSNK